MGTIQSVPEKPWHSEESLQKALIDFHHDYATFPKAEIEAAQPNFNSVLDTIQREMKKKGIAVRLEYAGSSYEGIKVGSTKVEFDVMVILADNGDIDVEPLSINSLYATLLCATREGPLSKMVMGDKLVPHKAAEYFQGQLHRIINEVWQGHGIKLKQHGPAIQMDVTQSGLNYSVDMVPSFNIGDEYYVAKPFKGDGDCNEEWNDSWRKSYSLEEKRKIRTIDRGNQCRKQCIRILKVLKDREPGLFHINSYIIKTAVLFLDEEAGLDWSQKKMGQRFIDILWYLSEKIKSGTLSHFFEQDVELLTEWTVSQCQNVASRLKELVRSETHFYQALGKAKHESFGFGDSWQPARTFDPCDDDTYSQTSFATTEPEISAPRIGALVGGAIVLGALFVGLAAYENSKKK